MTEMAVTEARARLSDVVATARTEPVFLTKHGHREAVVISMAEYERMLEAREDLEDIAAAEAAMAEIKAGAPTIPLEKVMADLGLA